MRTIKSRTLIDIHHRPVGNLSRNRLPRIPSQICAALHDVSPIAEFVCSRLEAARVQALIYVRLGLRGLYRRVSDRKALLWLSESKACDLSASCPGCRALCTRKEMRLVVRLSCVYSNAIRMPLRFAANSSPALTPCSVMMTPFSFLSCTPPPPPTSAPPTPTDE